MITCLLSLAWTTAAFAAPSASVEVLVADTSVSDAALAARAASPDWRVRLPAEAALVWRTNPAFAEPASEATPLTTRAGFLRFTGDVWRTPGATSIVLDRYLHGGEDPAVRAALADLLPRTEGEWVDVVASVFTAEPDPLVRAVFLADLKRVDHPQVITLLALGVADSEPRVREEAARVMGWRSEEADLWVDPLLVLLGDSHGGTRAAAARSLGNLQASAATPALRPLLADADGEVRLQALRALERTSPDGVRSFAELATLARDPDPRVARAAAQLLGQ